MPTKTPNTPILRLLADDDVLMVVRKKVTPMGTYAVCKLESLFDEEQPPHTIELRADQVRRLAKCLDD